MKYTSIIILFLVLFIAFPSYTDAVSYSNPGSITLPGAMSPNGWGPNRVTLCPNSWSPTSNSSVPSDILTDTSIWDPATWSVPCFYHNYSYNGGGLDYTWSPISSTYPVSISWNISNCTANDLAIGYTTIWANDFLLCRRWDDREPEIDPVSISFPDHDVWIDTPININFNPVEQPAQSWWTWNGSIESWLREARYCIKTTPVWPPCDVFAWTIATSYSQSADSAPLYWNRVYYSAWDNAGNGHVAELAIVKIDTTVPLAPIITGNPWSDDIWSNVVTWTITSPPETAGEISPRYNEYCIDFLPATSTLPTPDVSSPCTPNLAMTWPISLVGLPEGIHWFRVHTCTQVPNCWPATNFRIKIDTTPPNFVDVTNSNPLYMLADNDFDYNISIDTANGSQISSVTYRRENSLNTSMSSNLSMSWPSSVIPTSSTWSFPWDIQEVDNDRETSWPAEWGRDYRFQLRQVCDDAWNCSTDVPINSFHYVYADTLTWPFTATADISSLSGSTLLVASDISRDATLEIQDRFWNHIIPAASIGREIDLNVQANNELRMNQYNNNGTDSALYIDNIWSGDSIIATGPSWLGTLSDISPEASDIYDLQFYVYAPTNNWDAFVPGWATVTDMIVDVRDTIHNIWSNTIPTITWDTAVVRAAPLFTTNFSWEIVDFGFIEWVNQVSSVDITKTNFWISTSNDNLRLEFWEVASASSNVANPQYQMSVGWATLTEWTQPLSFSIPVVVASSLTPQTINSQMVQDSTVLTLEDSYLASIVQYDIWPGTVTYPYDVVWKTSYYSWVAEDNTIQTWIRILWNTVSDTNQEVVENQFIDDVRILWKLTKSSFRKDIEENVYSTVSSVNPKPVTATSLNIANTDLSANSWSDAKFDIWSLANRGLALFNDTVLYYGDLGGSTVTIGSTSTPLGTTNLEWIKTIVVENWNIYIENNIENSDGDGILWIIALSDDRNDTSVGNIYINPNVTDVHAVMYTNKAVISYDGVNELDWNTNQTVLANQLYIRGSIFSENTIWGSRSNPDLICPFYVNVNCSNFSVQSERNNAQKYDLNFVRRFFVYDSNINGTIEYDGSDTPANGWNIANGWASYLEFPLIVEYNSLVQQTPPPFFE